MKRAPWLPDVLRAAGLEVVTHAGFERRGRDFVDLTHLVWHHDASPVGDSPGVPGYMLRQMAAGKAGAQLWVDRYGTWHVLAAGVAFHAGTVLPGKPGNARSLGVELDHTTGERWPTAQLDSLRRGSAAILVAMGRSETSLEFHKTICHPPGRKTDPDGLSLLAERARVGALLVPPMQPAGLVAGTPTTPTVQEDNDVARLIRPTGKNDTYGTDGTSKWYVPAMVVLSDLIRVGIYGDGKVHEVSQETIDALPLVEVKP